MTAKVITLALMALMTEVTVLAQGGKECIPATIDVINGQVANCSDKFLITTFSDPKCDNIIKEYETGQEISLENEERYFNMLEGKSAELGKALSKAIVQLSDVADLENGTEQGLVQRQAVSESIQLVLASTVVAAGWANNGITWATSCGAWDSGVSTSVCVLTNVGVAGATILFLMKAFTVGRIGLTKFNDNGIYAPWQRTPVNYNQVKRDGGLVKLFINDQGNLAWEDEDFDGATVGSVDETGLNVHFKEQSGVKRDVYTPSPYGIQIRAVAYNSYINGPNEYSYDTLKDEFIRQMQCSKPFGAAVQTVGFNIRSISGTLWMSGLMTPYDERGIKSTSRQRASAGESIFLSDICSPK